MATQRAFKNKWKEKFKVYFVEANAVEVKVRVRSSRFLPLFPLTVKAHGTEAELGNSVDQRRVFNRETLCKYLLSTPCTERVHAVSSA